MIKKIKINTKENTIKLDDGTILKIEKFEYTNKGSVHLKIEAKKNKEYTVKDVEDMLDSETVIPPFEYDPKKNNIGYKKIIPAANLTPPKEDDNKGDK